MQLLDIEKDLSGQNAETEMLRYDGQLVALDVRLKAALSEGLPPDEYAGAEQLKDAVEIARKLLRLAVKKSDLSK